MLRSYIFIFTLLLFTSCGMDTVLQEHRALDYPSASAVAYHDGRIYVMGDDAPYMLVLDTVLSPIDTIQLFPSAEKRIPKNIKADLESMTLLPDKKIFLTGSASLMPYRFNGYLIDPSTKKVDSFHLDGFYRRFADHGIEQINIEGMTTIPGAMVLANRGNMSYRHNHLVFTAVNFWEEPAKAPINKAFIGADKDSASFQGVSGLAYARKNDWLIATVSTEATNNAYDDGAIGKSYVWIVKGISGKTRWKGINPDKVIDLESIDAAFKGQKIEGVTVMKETKDYVYLILVADDDKGGSNIFKVALKL